MTTGVVTHASRAPRPGRGSTSGGRSGGPMRNREAEMNTRIVVAVAALALLSTAACQGRTSLFTQGGRGAAPGGAGTVQLTAQDLAPIDAYIHHRTATGEDNTRWIVGDQVEIVASREMFGQHLTFTRAMGFVERVDDTSATETRVTLTYLGAEGSETVETNPRVLIGTGLTVSARRKLVVRLVKTQDPARPVYLSITAKGLASRGRHDEVEQRAPMLTMGGELRRGPDGRYVWKPFG